MIKRLVQEGASACLSAAQIPSMLIEKGYKLKGWQAEKTGDELMDASKISLQKLKSGDGILVTVKAAGSGLF